MKRANKTKIGIFVVGAIVLLIAGIIIFGTGLFIKQSDKYIVFFDGSVKGLSVGAPVNFRGVKIGNVSSIDLVYDKQAKRVLIPVIVDVELSRVGGVAESFGYPNYQQFIQDGLRVKLEVQNFLTGQLMLGMDFYPQNNAKFYGIVKSYPEIPALAISPDIFEVMNEIPVKEITINLAEAVKGLNRLINSEGFSGLDRTFREITQSARSFGLLIEYLELHPEALIRGKSVNKGE